MLKTLWMVAVQSVRRCLGWERQSGGMCGGVEAGRPTAGVTYAAMTPRRAQIRRVFASRITMETEGLALHVLQARQRRHTESRPASARLQPRHGQGRRAILAALRVVLAQASLHALAQE